LPLARDGFDGLAPDLHPQRRESSRILSAMIGVLP
jgi:hypothetical protein